MADAKPPSFLNSDPKKVKDQHLLSISSKKKAEPAGPDPKILEELSMINRRLKLLETSFSNLRSKTQSVENNEIQNNKENRVNIKALEEENNDIHGVMRDIQENLKIIISELKQSAKKQEISTIQHYLDMWNPVQFITKDQAKKLAKDVYEEMQRKNL